MTTRNDGQYEHQFEKVMKVLGGKLGPGQTIMKKLIDNASLTANGVYLTRFGFNDLIVDSKAGKIPRVHNDQYETRVNGVDIQSKRYDSSEWLTLYNGETGEFNLSGITAYDGYTTASKNYPAIKLREFHGERGRKIRVHHIIYGMVFGYDVLLAMEEGPCDIHHIRGLEAGSGIDNLQLLLSCDHQSLEKSLWWITHRQHRFLETEYRE